MRALALQAVCGAAFFTPLLLLAQTTDDGSGLPPESRSNTIVIRADRSIEERFAGTGSRVIVGRQDIEQMGADTVVDVLKQLPGVQVSGEGTGSPVISMRGMNSSATQVLIDGERTTRSRSSAQLPLDQLPSEMIERIEIMRAPTAEFSGASAGTINIVLKQATVKKETAIRLTDQRVWGKNGPGLFFSHSGPLNEPSKLPLASSKNDSRNTNSIQAEAASDAASKHSEVKPDLILDRPWTYFFGAVAAERILGSDTATSTSTGTASTNIPTQSTNQTQSRLLARETTFFPRLQGRLGNGDQVSLRSTLSVGQTTGATTSNATGTDANGATSSNVNQSNDSTRAMLQLRADHTHVLKGKKIESYISGQKNSENINRPQTLTTTNNLGSTNSQSTYNNDRSDRALLMSTKLSNTEGANVWMVGAEREARRLTLDNTTTSSSAAATSLNLNSVFTRNVLWGQNEWGVKWNEKTSSTLTAGLRVEGISVNNNYNASSGAGVQTNTWTIYQPSLHLRTAIDANSQWRANIARVARNPSPTDFLNLVTPSQGINSPTNPNVTGNPNLRSESALAIDLGIEQRLGDSAGPGGQLGGNVFIRQLNDALGQRVYLDSANNWTQQAQNMGQAMVWGLEGDAKTTLRSLGIGNAGSDWSLNSSATLLQSRMMDPIYGGNRIPGQARYIIKTSIAKPQRRSGGYFGGASIGITGASDYVTSTSAAATGIASSGYNKGYVTLDAYVGAVVPGYGFWRLGVFNLTNAARNSVRINSSATFTTTSDATTTLTPRVLLMVGTQF